ncbi:hypothetical protein ACFE04_024096 [Oxalis oulophora]
MASSSSLFVVYFLFALLAPSIFVTSASLFCPNDSPPAFIYDDVYYQCPLSIYSTNPPLEVNGDFLDRVLAIKQRSGVISVLFYASWCPFSQSLRPKFDALSSMFPEIKHLAVEQSSAMPSVFSRYGIHSLPSILLVNQTSKVPYRGLKDLDSIVQFYERTTGLKAVQYSAVYEPKIVESAEKSVIQKWKESSVKEITKREPFLVFAILFLCLRVFLYVFPRVLAHLIAFWVSCVPTSFNLEIFGETSQLFGRALHMIDVRRIWTKLRLCKTRNFHEGARNARVWASSLASVSLGESSSARSSSS